MERALEPRTMTDFDEYLALFTGQGLRTYQLKQLLAASRLTSKELRSRLSLNSERRWRTFNWSALDQASGSDLIATHRTGKAFSGWDQFKRDLRIDQLSYRSLRNDKRIVRLMIDYESWAESDRIKPGYRPGDEIVCWYPDDLPSGSRRSYEHEVRSFAGRGKTWIFPSEVERTPRPFEKITPLVGCSPRVGQYRPLLPGRAGLGCTASSLPLTAPGGPLVGRWPGQAARPYWRFDDQSGVAEKQRQAYFKACSSSQVQDAVPPEQRLRMSEMRISSRNELRSGVGKAGR